MADIEDTFSSISVNGHKDIKPELLERMMNDIFDADIQDRKEMEKIITSFQKKYKTRAAKRELLNIYRYMCQRDGTEYDKKYEYLLQAHPVRSQSGVQVIAVVLSPYPNGKQFTCDWNCFYCPLQPGQPRSYLKEEPGVLRANMCNFDPVLMVHDRLKSYVVNGHPTDKIELIVLGGTWASYPEDYQYDFITKLYYGANIFGDKEQRPIGTLEEEIKINETAKSRVIGLTLETRPDCITKRELTKFRRMGVTRIQMGIQHLNDRVLDRVNRMCKTVTAIKAIKMLKDNCFKVDIHIMLDLPKPLLPGVNPSDPELSKDDIDWDVDMFELDLQMILMFCNHPDFQADQWKIYPCQVTPYTVLKEQYDKGLHTPYSEEMSQVFEKYPRLFEMLLFIKQNMPKHIRTNRIIRDIPGQYIKGGCKDTNMNQYLISHMKKNNIKCKCIRCREVKDQQCDIENAKLCVSKYRSSKGDEYFLSFEDQAEETLYGFLRLRITDEEDNEIVMDELKGVALIRELHVYGKTISVSNGSTQTSAQHIGFGTRLLQEAEKIAKDNNFQKIAVISGVGVREYYRKRGYADGQYFLFKDI
jgi:ELP3 family radical SAM enzyme/protein acetyltransferase